MSENKRIAKNAIYLYFRMFLVMGVGLYTSRVVLKQLGVSDYGVYSLVGGFVALFGFLRGAMSSATQRYLTFHLGRDDFEQLRKTFSATLTIHGGIAILVLLFAETVGLWYVNEIMVYPVDRTFAVNVVYQFSIAAAMLEIVQVPYNALIIAHERMKIYAYVSIAEVVLKLSVALLLIFLTGDKLIIYAILFFVVVLMIRLFYQFYCRKHYKESKYKLEWDKPLYKELISFSGWSLFGSMAALARTQGNNIILNLFFGTVINAAYGITVQVQSAILSFAVNFQMAVNPQIIKRFSKGSLKEMEELICQSSKFSFFMLLVISIPLYINIDYILELWLFKVPKYTAIFIQLSLVYILIDSLSFSLMKGIQATGKIKYYQMILGTFICLSLPISYFFLKLGYQPEMVFYILIVITFLSLVIRMFFVRKLLGFSPLVFIKKVIIPASIVCLGLFFIYSGIKNYLAINLSVDNIGSLIVNLICSVIIVLIVVLVGGVNKNEKKKILNFIRRK